MEKVEIKEEEKIETLDEALTDNELTDDEKRKLDEYEQKVSTGKTKKKKIWNVIFFIFNIVLVVGLVTWQLMTDDDVSSAGELKLNVWFTLLLIAFFLFTVFLDCIPIDYLVRKACKRPRIGVSFKTTIFGRYYDNITPLSSGGEPAQVTYLMSYDVPSAAALSIPIAKLFFAQLTVFIVTLACIIASFSYSNLNSFVSIASYIGFAFNFLMLAINFFLAISKNLGKKIVVKVLKFLHKIKIIKNYEKQYKRTTEYIADYQNIMIQYMRSPKDFIIMFLSVGAKLVTTYMLPYFIYCAFYGTSAGCDFGMMFTMGVLIDTAASFIPIPGGSGVSELSFNAMFAMFFGGDTIWAMLVYRFFTYYFYLVLGLALTSYDFAYGKKKYLWKKKQRALQAESVEFRQIQIKNFRDERAIRRKRQTKKS